MSEGAPDPDASEPAAVVPSTIAGALAVAVAEATTPAVETASPASDPPLSASDAISEQSAAVMATPSAPLTEEIALDDDLVPGAAEAAADIVPDTSDLPPGELRAVVEALLFVATRPLPVERVQQCLPGTSPHYLDGFLAGLAERYDHENRGWELRRIAGGWQLLTRRQFHPWVRQLERKELPTRLSKGALETLSIVAYKQPITRGQVEDIRGVQCGPVLRQLMDLKLVVVIGRAEDLLGRPLLYATSEHFLVRFGLGGLGDLPRKHEFGA